MRSIFLSREQVLEKPIPLLKKVGAAAPASDLALLTAPDDGFLQERGGGINYYLADGCVDRFGRGGSCAVYPLTTAWGTSFVTSGPIRMSFLKNGAYYDVDQGVQPDYTIQSFDHYYDRNALAEFVSSLY